jgi:hypothetical protein
VPGQPGLNSVSTLLLLSRNTSYDDFVLDRVKSAHAIWFAGI